VQDATATPDQKKRFSAAKKISGTFIPAAEQLQMFRISSDTTGTLTDSSSSSITLAMNTPDLSEMCMPGKYVTAVYAQAWYAGDIVD